MRNTEINNEILNAYSKDNLEKEPIELIDIREESRLIDLREAINLSSSLLSLPLFLAFWFADILYVPNQIYLFGILRLCMVPVCLLTNSLVKKANTLSQMQNIGIFFVAANAWNITAMVFLSEGPQSPYYAGLNLVCIGCTAHVPWTKKYLFIMLNIIYLPYFIGIIFLTIMGKYSLKNDASAFVINSFFIIGSLIICIIIRYYSEKLRNKTFKSRYDLMMDIKNRDSIIKKKTDEAIEMKKLSSQFSPQVIRAISDKKINIEGKPKRGTICAIFSDIVGSTRKINSLSLKAHNKILDMYIEDSMKVLLKYDVTIDKFTGDGNIAFSNAPLPRDDYINRVIDAALEIRKRIEGRQSEYSALWGGPFSIKTGIAIGTALVGFKGNSDVFLHYTAIGSVMNLASRLCSHCGPNDILISTEFPSDTLPFREYNFKEFGDSSKYKGFENKTSYPVFSVVDHITFDNSSTSSESIMTCPNGHGIMHLEVNDKGIYEFHCHSCSYIATS